MALEPQDRAPEVVERKDDGTFAEGQSGNAGGQPRWVKAIRDGLFECSPLAVKALREILDGTRKVEVVTKAGVVIEVEVGPKEVVAAAKTVLEFTLPKPKTSIEVTDVSKNPAEAPDLSKFSLEELVQWRALMAKAGRTGGGNDEAANES